MSKASASASAPVVALVEEAVEAKMRGKEPFTALDISNDLKDRRFPVRHGEVASVVRDIYASGAMAHYDYDRRLIDVVTGDGAKQAQAYLYLHEEGKEREYTDRQQSALPLVPAALARSLDDAVPANNPLSPLVMAGRAQNYRTSANAAGRARRTSRSSGGGRRDGALAIPRALAREAGWDVGDTLALARDATAQGSFLLKPASPDDAANPAVRVWGALRVRVARTKLTALAIPTGSFHFSVEGGAVRVQA